VKADVSIYGSHNPCDENHRVSCLRENLTSSSEGEGLETGISAPRQSFTRQEDYKTLKYRLEVENFSGKSVLSVYQDFHAKLFSKNLAATVASTTKKEIIKKSEKFIFAHQINFAQALSKMKNTIVVLFNRSLEEVDILVEKLRTIFIQTTEAIRPNRKYPRRHRVKQARFFYEYKTTC
jgi:hypothetical protein